MPSDLRLVAPAASAWAVTALTLTASPAHRALLPIAALAAAATALLLLAVTGLYRRAATTVAAALLTASAATFTTLLHTADLHRGPIPALSRPTAPPLPASDPNQSVLTSPSVPTAPSGPTSPSASNESSTSAESPNPTEHPIPSPDLTVDLTITGDPKPHSSRTRGTAPTQPLLTIRATVDRVELPTPVRTSTPVTLMVRSQEAAAWQPLLPSTRVRTTVRVLPTDPRAGAAASTNTAALLLARTPPQQLAPPNFAQRLAGTLRAGLRRASDHLPADTRGLLPGLVVGDTSRLPDDLAEAFRATDLGHLTAVSGANLAIILTVLIGSSTSSGSRPTLGQSSPTDPFSSFPPHDPNQPRPPISGHATPPSHRQPEQAPDSPFAPTVNLASTTTHHAPTPTPTSPPTPTPPLIPTAAPGRTPAPATELPRRSGLAGFLGLSLRTTALLGTAFTLAFVTICRPDPSVLRAAATGLIGLLALATGRPRRALTALSAAVLTLVLLDPALSRSYGFLLSALATTGLLTLGPPWQAALLARRWPHHLASAVAATAAAQALCAPVTVLLAPRVSLVAIPCNVLAEAAVAPATLLGFATLAVAPFSPVAARVLADLAALPTAWLTAVARRGAALPGAQLDLPAGIFGAALLAVATVALVWSTRPLSPGNRVLLRAFLSHRDASSRPSPNSRSSASSPPHTGPRSHRHPASRPHPHPPSRRRIRLAPVALITTATSVLVAVLLRPPLLTRIATGWPPAGWRLVMCDVGQGDMTVLPVAALDGASSDAAVVIDAGPDPRAADTCLRSLGVSRVPLVILSHFHADHAEGLPGVLRGRTVGALQVTAPEGPVGEQARVQGWATAAHVPVVRAAQGEHRSAGKELSWEVLWPEAHPTGVATGANNASVTLLATVGPPADPLRLALLGDLEAPAQAALRGSVRPPSVDVLKVAHHGSASQDWELAADLNPRLALISCGEGNTYGHPSSQTLDHLRALGATVLRTDRAGDIAVLGGSSTLRAATHPHRHLAGAPARSPPMPRPSRPTPRPQHPHGSPPRPRPPDVAL
ncbi:hypothetical protein CFP65_2343 [Kitasatospora sp. MMS16-BH015]|uniref:ComEC/Rec2 family competence protein n=1 Tax=Kitasatospora sp. MMS16-BH015 TaxID=2018025 RepID=UPI000CA1C4FE|nr:ComEC/Rec2 family competence protein [Kitasatospora sp. MMS16-BH015]AUG77181.1 hypothetical protein CFP65_2343 [Kitasatospora sp. MMS16-BH015]